MGNMCSSQLTVQYLEDFHEPYNQENAAFKYPIEIYEHSQDPQFKLIKMTILGTYFNLQETLASLEQRFQHPHILSIHNVEHNPISITLYTDYPLAVEDCVTYKLPQLHLWELIIHIASALAALQERKQRYLSINPRGLYKVYTHNQEFVYKIADPFFIHHQAMPQFQCPELRAANHPNTNLYKSDVFSLGLVALYCLGVKEDFLTQDGYNFQAMHNALTGLQLQQNIDYILRFMLAPTEEERPDCMQLFVSLNNVAKVYELTTSKFQLAIYAKQQLNNTLPAQIEQPKTYIDIPSPIMHQKQAPPQISQKVAGHQNYSNGCYYVGEYHAVTLKRDGIGIFFSREGSKLIEGTFLNDMPDGDDIQMWREEEHESTHLDLSDWTYFRGAVEKGIRNGNNFKGNFMDDKACGSGEYRYSNHTVVGTWMYDKFVE